MAGITLAEAENNLSVWLAASEAVAANQSYTIGDRTLTRANAASIERMITFWDQRVKQLSSRSRHRTRYVVPK